MRQTECGVVVEEKQEMMDKQDNMIAINHLNKSFGTVKAVNNLSFRVKKGELFAFIG